MPGVCPLVGEADPEASAGFLEGRAGAWPLLGGTESQSSRGQQCVYGAGLELAVGLESL